MTPFKIECPECGSALKISDPAHIGKKAKCPRCRGYMTIPEPPDHEPPPLPRTSPSSRKPPRKPLEDDFLSDDASDEFDELPAEPAPKKKPAAKKKSRKRSKSSSDGALARAGGVAIAVLIVLFVGFRIARPFLKLGNAFGWFNQASGIGPDLTWIPDGVDAVTEFRVAEMVKSGAVSQALQTPEAMAGVAMMTGLVGFNLHDVESLRFGVFAAPTAFDDSTRFSGVLKLSKPGSVLSFLENATTATPPTTSKTQHGSRTIYTPIGMPEIALCCIDEQTVLFGGVKELKSVLDKDGRAESTSRFAFLDKPRQVSVIIAPVNPKGATGYLGTSSMNMFQKSPMSGICFCGDIDAAIHGAMLINADSTSDAKESIKQFERDRQKLAGSVPLMIPGGQQLQQALRTAVVTGSGRLVSLQVEIPADVVSTLIASAGPGALGLPPASGRGSTQFASPPNLPINPPQFSPSDLPTPLPADFHSGFGSPTPQPQPPARNPLAPTGASPFKPKSAPGGQSPATAPANPFRPKGAAAAPSA